ncbi:Phenylalanine-specific permease [Brachybacterium faecium]|uniref:Gamma-aminobutyrate permease-like transporter n=1 Tax=Brachybacterium faecium (strain ATCC 43885 / DSM 4810 / JCM 11609 / LMG 19847 / NBRC 14762 / NCIMB 9860 / 6-10) TaxID=446465 RepID=C7MB44_BRAFD|nr:amino acid permease [Brachybacterium faecium]ACU86931.1 gamma-aminobutyrate permease-like transporter [Brachybacterium faecium DSM 4810]SLN01774.1 Phenylalanine-specific permease [Brachybacterium faecium]HJG52493.1 amino acid permease [Brachybacterium faecium]
MTTSTTDTDHHQDRHLARSLGHGQMAMIAMGSALGTGLFLGSGEAIGIAGPAVILSFAIGSLIAATIALAMGEMASRHPVRGGFGTLAARYLSPFWGYLSRWLYWIVTVCVTGAELVACAAYLAYWVPAIPIWAGILIFAAVIIAINLSSVGSFGVIEFFLSSIKVIAVFVFILVGAVLVFVGLPSQPAAGIVELTADGGFAPMGWGAVWLALSVVMFSFGGIELLSITAAEAKDPARSIRTAARTTIVRLAFFYVAAIGIVLCLVPWQQAAGAREDVATSPFVMVFDRVGIPGAAHVTNLLVLVAALSAANANLYAGSRILHSLASDGLAPRIAAATTARKVPMVGIVASSVGLIGAAVLAFSGVGGVFNYMMSLVVFAVLMVWALILVTYVAYRRRGITGATFRMPGGSVTAAVGLFGLLAVFATVTVSSSMQIAALVGGPAVVLATVLYFTVLRGRIDPAHIDEAFDEAESMR